MVHAGLKENQDPISKTTREKKTGDMAEVIEHLFCKYKALN
jgi:hypothetical protein